MPAYNVENYIEEAVNSILNQTYCNFEFLIIDDGSTDRTPDILNNFIDPRIKLVFNEKNEGNYPARNKGCRLAKGKYIAVMDADDVALPERLAIQVKYMEENPEVQLCGGAYKLIGKNLTIVEPTKYEEIQYVLIKTFCILHPTIMFRRKELEEVGYYQVNSLYAEDYNLILRFARRGVVANVPDVLLMRRQHDKQISTVHNKEQNEFARQMQLRYQHEMGIFYPPTNKEFFLSQLANYIRSTVSYVQTGGVYSGQLGLILFFYHYATYKEKTEYKDLADRMLGDILTYMRRDIPVGIGFGLCGIGIVIGYLIHCGFVEGEPDGVLSEIDEMVVLKTDFETDDWSFDTGIIGIIYYVSYRIATTKRERDTIFHFQYIHRLLGIIEMLQNHKDWACPCPEILSYCKGCLEGDSYVVNWDDFLKKVIMALPISHSLGTWNSGLNNGAAGWGINFMLNLAI